MVKKSDLRERVVDATMELAAERGWRSLSMADVAMRAKLPLADVRGLFSSKYAILDSYLHAVDDEMVRIEPDASEAATRDRLFDVIMRRLDSMADEKRALRRILRESGDDVYALACGTRRFYRTVALMLEAAGISSTGLGGLLRVEGLGAIYLYVLGVWLRDDTADGARTMAALDKSLRRAEGVAALIWRRRMAAPPGAQPSA